jgi:hypothetical protein
VVLSRVQTIPLGTRAPNRSIFREQLRGEIMAFRQARILILCKTYPSPSAAHTETSCVAGVEANGKPIRLFPVPFRLIDGDAQFKKWQWITAQVEKARRDHRKESHRIGVDTIDCQEPPLSTRNGWADRLKALSKIPAFKSPVEMEQSRLQSGSTIALLKPARILELDIRPTKTPDWTPEEKKKLLQQQPQTKLFAAMRRILENRWMAFFDLFAICVSFLLTKKTALRTIPKSLIVYGDFLGPTLWHSVSASSMQPMLGAFCYVKSLLTVRWQILARYEVISIRRSVTRWSTMLQSARTLHAARRVPRYTLIIW